MMRARVLSIRMRENYFCPHGPLSLGVLTSHAAVRRRRLTCVSQPSRYPACNWLGPSPLAFRRYTARQGGLITADAGGACYRPAA